jgi:CheY-like chemotaxis protein
MNTAREELIEILLVEDSPTDADLTVDALTAGRVRNRVTVVEDGVEAMAYLHREGKYATAPRPDLILLDLNLPRLSGQEVLKRIRAQEALATVPVIVLTTSSRQEDVQAVYAAGANTYIEKPQDFARFVQVLQTIQRYWLEMALLPPGSA